MACDNGCCNTTPRIVQLPASSALDGGPYTVDLNTPEDGIFRVTDTTSGETFEVDVHQLQCDFFSERLVLDASASTAGADFGSGTSVTALTADGLTDPGEAAHQAYIDANIDYTAPTGDSTSLNPPDTGAIGQTDSGWVAFHVVVPAGGTRTLTWEWAGEGYGRLEVAECGVGDYEIVDATWTGAGAGTAQVTVTLDAGVHLVRMTQVDSGGNANAWAYVGDPIEFYAESGAAPVVSMQLVAVDCDGNAVDANGDPLVGTLIPVADWPCPTGITVNAEDIVGDLFNVTAGTTAAAGDDSLGSATIGSGDTLHFYVGAPGEGLLVSEGSGIVRLPNDPAPAELFVVPRNASAQNVAPTAVETAAAPATGSIAIVTLTADGAGSEDVEYWRYNGATWVLQSREEDDNPQSQVFVRSAGNVSATPLGEHPSTIYQLDPGVAAISISQDTQSDQSGESAEMIARNASGGDLPVNAGAGVTYIGPASLPDGCALHVSYDSAGTTAYGYTMCPEATQAVECGIPGEEELITAAAGTLADGTTYAITGGTSLDFGATTPGDIRWNGTITLTFSNPVNLILRPTTAGDPVILDPLMWSYQNGQLPTHTSATRFESVDGLPLIVDSPNGEVLEDGQIARGNNPDAAGVVASDPWGTVTAPAGTEFTFRARSADAVNISAAPLEIAPICEVTADVYSRLAALEADNGGTVNIECFEEVTGNQYTVGENVGGTFSDGEPANEVSLIWNNTTTCSIQVDSVTLWARNPTATDDTIVMNAGSDTGNGFITSPPVVIPAGTAAFQPFTLVFDQPEIVQPGSDISIELGSADLTAIFAVTDQVIPPEFNNDGTLPAGAYNVIRLSGPEINRYNVVTLDDGTASTWNVTDPANPVEAPLPANARCCDDDLVVFPRLLKTECRQSVSTGEIIQRHEYSDGAVRFWSFDANDQAPLEDAVYYGPAFQECPLTDTQIGQVINIVNCATVDLQFSGLENGFNSPHTFEAFTPTATGEHTFTLTGTDPDAGTHVLEMLIGTTPGASDVFDGTGLGLVGASGSVDYTVPLTELVDVYVTIVASGAATAYWDIISVTSACPEEEELLCPPIGITDLEVDLTAAGPTSGDPGTVVAPAAAVTLSQGATGGTLETPIQFHGRLPGDVVDAVIRVTRLSAGGGAIQLQPSGGFTNSSGATDHAIEVELSDGQSFRWTLHPASAGGAEAFQFLANPVVEYAQGPGGVNLTLPFNGSWNNNNNGASSGMAFDAAPVLNFRSLGTAGAGSSFRISLRDVPTFPEQAPCDRSAAMLDYVDDGDAGGTAASENTINIECFQTESLGTPEIDHETGGAPDGTFSTVGASIAIVPGPIGTVYDTIRVLVRNLGAPIIGQTLAVTSDGNPINGGTVTDPFDIPSGDNIVTMTFPPVTVDAAIVADGEILVDPNFGGWTVAIGFSTIGTADFSDSQNTLQPAFGQIGSGGVVTSEYRTVTLTDGTATTYDENDAVVTLPAGAVPCGLNATQLAEVSEAAGDSCKIVDCVEIRGDTFPVTIDMPDDYTLVTTYEATVTLSDGGSFAFLRNANAHTDADDQADNWATTLNNQATVDGTWTAVGPQVTATLTAGDVYPVSIDVEAVRNINLNSGSVTEITPNLVWESTSGDITGRVELGALDAGSVASGGNGITANIGVAGQPDTLSITSTLPGWTAPDRFTVQVNDLDPGPGEFVEFDITPDSVFEQSPNLGGSNFTVTGNRVDPTINNLDARITFTGGVSQVLSQQRTFQGGSNRIGYREITAEWDFPAAVTVGEASVITLTRCGDDFLDENGDPVAAPAEFVACGTYAALDALAIQGAHADDAAAGVAGVAAGDLYQTDGTGAAPLNVPGIVMVKQ